MKVLRMHSETSAARRTLFLLLLLCAVVIAQTSSLASEHLHQHSSQHCCGLCHTGPLPFIQASVSSATAPAVSVSWLESASARDITHEAPITAGGSRAPPA